MCCQVNSDLSTLFGVSQVENTEQWFTTPFFCGCPGTMHVAQGHTGWLFSQEAQWGIELPTSDSEELNSQPLTPQPDKLLSSPASLVQVPCSSSEKF